MAAFVAQNKRKVLPYCGRAVSRAILFRAGVGSLAIVLGWVLIWWGDQGLGLPSASDALLFSNPAMSFASMAGSTREQVCGLPADSLSRSGTLRSVDGGVGGNHPSVAIMSIWAGGWSSWAGPLGDVNRRCYARTHRYAFRNMNHVINNTRPVAWSKILATLALMDERVQNGSGQRAFDWIVYVDADIVLMRPDLPLHRLIPELSTLAHMPGSTTYHQADFIATRDANGLNTGFFAVRNTPWARRLFRRAWSLEPLAWDCDQPFQYEQRAFFFLMEHDRTFAAPLLRTLPACSLSSQLAMRAPAWVQYSEGDFAVHLAGVYDDWATGRRDKLRLFYQLAMEGSQQALRGVEAGGEDEVVCTPPEQVLGKVPTSWYPSPSVARAGSKDESAAIQQVSCKEEYRGRSWEMLKPMVKQWED